MITTDLKDRIVAEMVAARGRFTGSDAKFAVTIGISNSQYSRVKRGELDRVLSDANWISIARQLGVSIGNTPKWNVANTPVYQFITAQLAMCQQQSMSALLCDLSDIGKTFTALQYVKNNSNAIYIDCSQVKSKQKLIRRIAKSFGVGSTGKYADVYDDLVFYLRSLPSPMIILDEAGDLEYPAFLEIKALWNATEMACGYYMMGADGLREKIRRAIDSKKVGYTEIFSRFGRKYGCVLPLELEERQRITQTSAVMIIKANATSEIDVKRVLRGTMGDDDMPSLRRIYKELSKNV